MHFLISSFSFYNNRTTIAMFNGLVQIFKFFQQRSGRIIIFSSGSGLGNSGQTNYAAAKEGQVGFVRSLSRELAPFNITVNATATYGTVTWDMQPSDETVQVSDSISISSHSASMVDGGTLTYSATGLGMSGLSLNSTTGEIYAMADMATAGTYSNIIITAYDDSAACSAACATSRAFLFSCSLS